MPDINKIIRNAVHINLISAEELENAKLENERLEIQPYEAVDKSVCVLCEEKIVYTEVPNRENDFTPQYSHPRNGWLPIRLWKRFVIKYRWWMSKRKKNESSHKSLRGTGSR